MINNRQAGRRRGRGGNGQGGQGGGQSGGNGPRQNGGQRDSGNRIDSRARGNANQLYEKYKNLASDAQRQGDRVNTEYYLQFADHYFRVLSETRNRFEEQNQQRRPQNDGYEAQAFTGSFDTGFDNQDDEFGDEGEPIRQGEQALGEDRNEDRNGDRDGNRNPDRNTVRNPDRSPEQRGDRDGNQRGDRQNGAANGQNAGAGPNLNGQNGQRDNAPRETPQRENSTREGGDRPRRDGRQQRDGNRQADDGDRNDREQTVQLDASPSRYESARPDPVRPDPVSNESVRLDPVRTDGVRAEANPDEPRRIPRTARRDRDEGAPEALATNGQDVPLAADVGTPVEAPRRRGRPRREQVVDDAPAAFDVSLLPPSLGTAPAAPVRDAAGSDVARPEASGPEASGQDVGEEKPRRRRVRAAVEAPPASG